MTDDGKSLLSTSHPIGITEEMVAAGIAAQEREWHPSNNPTKAVKAIFEAMVLACPPEPEISDDALETVEIEIDAWRPIGSAPKNVSVLLWWRPKDSNPLAESCVIGQVSSYEPGKWWNEQTGTYQDLSHITHWMPLPEKPIP